MKLRLLTVGRTLTPWIEEGISMYTSRIGRYAPFAVECVADVKATRSLTPERQKEEEGRRLLAAIGPGETVVLLDERGRELTSRELAAFVDARLATGATKGLVFVVGGPYGFSPEVYARASFKLSLSKLTFPHELVRLLFVEQLYRAFTILRGEPYHHD